MLIDKVYVFVKILVIELKKRIVIFHNIFLFIGIKDNIKKFIIIHLLFLNILMIELKKEL